MLLRLRFYSRNIKFRFFFLIKKMNKKMQSKNLCCELGRASKSALKTLNKQLRMAAGSTSKKVAAKRVDETTYVLQLGKNRQAANCFQK